MRFASCERVSGEKRYSSAASGKTGPALESTLVGENAIEGFKNLINSPPVNTGLFCKLAVTF